MLLFLHILIIIHTVTLVTPFHKSNSIENDVKEIRSDNNELSYRLPNNTKPELYKLILNTDVHKANFSFDGVLKIIFRTSNHDPGRNITLHLRQLTISKVSLFKFNDITPIPLNNWYFVKEREFLIIPTKSELKNDTRYELHIIYNGTLRNDMGGFYRSSYIDNAGHTRWLATTQFQTTNARHAFPCYDEPALKAKFQIQINHGANYTANSNMPLEQSVIAIPNSDKVQSIFQTTVPMSTYLVAFVVSDFKYTTNINLSNNGQIIPHRVWSKPNSINETFLALNAGVQILTAISNYLNTSYSLPKMDQIAIPDFAPGAMENWGLVSYKENLLLFNDSTSKFTSQIQIVSIISHEFSHQWFGNLVSPRWWTYLWLNEGFATLFSFIAIELVYPEWNHMDFFILNSLQIAFSIDENYDAVAMTDYIPNPDAMTSEFSAVSYNKAGSVIRMFLNAFTEQSFKKGLTHYLKQRAFNDAAEEDLFDALENAVKTDNTLSPQLNVSDLMKSWTRQKGFPLLRVNRNYTTGTIEITQSRYLANTTIVDTTTWWIPYNFMTSNDKPPAHKSTFADYWLPKNVTLYTINQTNDHKWSSNDWIIFNKNHTGYYRVIYDKDNYDLIVKGLQAKNFRRIPMLNRAQIIDDAFSFVGNGLLDYGVALNLTKYLHKEIEYIPWRVSIVGLAPINKLFAANESFSKFEKFIARLTAPIVKYIGITDLPNESHQNKYLRNNIIAAACSSGEKTCLKLTNAKLKEILKNGSEPHENIRSTIYCAGLRQTTKEILYDMWKRLNQSNNDRDLIITALACTWNEAFLNDFLYSTLNATNQQFINYSLEEKENIVISVSNNGQKGVQIALNFMQDNLNVLNKTFDRNSLHEIITEIAKRVVSEKLLKQFQNVTKTMQQNGMIEDVTVKTAMQICEKNFQWLKINSDSVYHWVIANDDGTQYFQNSIFFLILSFTTTLFVSSTFNL